MSDNVKVILNISALEDLVEKIGVDATHYCILFTEDAADTYVITTDHELKRVLIDDYDGEELSDWKFTKMYDREPDEKSFQKLGNQRLLDKGY